MTIYDLRLLILIRPRFLSGVEGWNLGFYTNFSFVAHTEIHSATVNSLIWDLGFTNDDLQFTIIDFNSSSVPERSRRMDFGIWNFIFGIYPLYSSGGYP